LRGHGQPLIAHAKLSVPALFAAQVPGQPRSGFRGVDPAAGGIDFFQFLTGSPQSLSASGVKLTGPQGRPSRLRVTFIGVAFGHLNARHVRRSLRLGGGGNRAPHWFSGIIFFPRAQVLPLILMSLIHPRR